MRRIALVCDWYHPRRGGIEAHLDGLATRLSARGHQVLVITATPGPTTVNGVRVHRLDIPRLPYAGVAMFPAASSIARLLAGERIDLVHNHVSIVAPIALGGALAAHRAGLPNVLTFHSFVPATPVLASITGHVMGTSGWSAVMTAVSQRVVREVNAFSPGVPFSVLPNAIDTTFWTPGDDAAGRGIIHLVFAGRLQAKKRPLLLLRVLRELVRVAADRPWRLTIAGEGPLASALRRGVRDLALESRVDFAGWIDRDQLRRIMRSDAVFLSTATRESFGLAALEARATGAPVVAVRDSAVADFIADGESGLLAADDDAFAAAVSRLVRDDVLRERIAAFNRRVPAGFGWDECLDLHERRYDEAGERVRQAVAIERSFQLPRA